ncbi:MAG: hypothetical protein ACRYG4_10325 [Janthinobacterium lividum]
MLRATVILLSLTAVPAVAADAGDPSAPTLHRLSPGEVDAALASGEERNRAADALAAVDGTGRKIHGEVGLGVATGGGREAFGSMIAPLGETGTAAFSYDYTNFGNNRLSRRND